MDAVYRWCAAIDVHKESCEVCIRRLDADGKVRNEARSFGTTTRAILELGDWLEEQGVQIAAMESTGVYWKPLWNLLEGRVELILVNARHFRNVPGRKTDKNDAQWLAELLQHGLLRPSFVPARRQRQLRDLTRQRHVLVQDKTRIANRIQKVLEDANLKLSSVASDVLGVSGRDMIRSIIAGERDPTKLADLARRSLRSKIPLLREALEGGATDHHRFLLRMHMDHLLFLEREIAALEQRICSEMAQEQEAIGRLAEMPGIDTRIAQAVIAEIGVDMSRFPTAAHLCSWAKLCPGMNESAGKRKSSRTGQGNRWLKAVMSQAAWGASRSKKSYYAAQYRRLAARRGKKRALIAVAKSLLETIYCMLKRGARFKDLGVDFLDRLEPDRLTRSLVKRLQKLGHTVNLQPRIDAA
jgi:transposase